MDSSNISRPVNTNPSNMADIWVSALKRAAKKEQLNEGTNAASITEIYHNSQEIFNKAQPKEQQEIANHLATLINLKSTKLNKTIKETNATWLTALKVFMAATVILSPIAAIIHYNQIKTTSAAEQKLKELEALVKTGTEEFSRAIQARTKYFGMLDKTASLLNQAFKEKLPETSENDPISIRTIHFGNFTHKHFESETEKMIQEAIKARTKPLNEQQIYKDFARNHTLNLIEKQDKKSVTTYKSTSGHAAVAGAVKEEKLNKKDGDAIVEFEIEHIRKIIKDVETKIGDKNWSDVVLAVCQQGLFTDFYPLEDPDVPSRQWKGADQSEHEIKMATLDHYDVHINRDNENKIESVTVNAGGPLRFYEKISKNGITEEQNINYPLSYHLVLKITLDSKNEPHVEILRREFTKE